MCVCSFLSKFTKWWFSLCFPPNIPSIIYPSSSVDLLLGPSSFPSPSDIPHTFPILPSQPLCSAVLLSRVLLPSQFFSDDTPNSLIFPPQPQKQLLKRMWISGLGSTRDTRGREKAVEMVQTLCSCVEFSNTLGKVQEMNSLLDSPFIIVFQRKDTLKRLHKSHLLSPK